MPRSLPTPCLLALVAIIGGLLLETRPAGAWIEKRVESSSTVIELDSNGSAIVRYRISLDVRGAPLSSFTLDGVDIDAEPLENATVTRMKGGMATSLPLPVPVTALAGRLEIDVPLRQGFRGRNFLLEFAYRTRLLERGLIRLGPEPGASVLHWIGPRFDDGVDSVTLLIRSAAGARAPEPVSETDETRGEPAANFGIVMSTLRRSRDHDELELVRAHVARSEAITWQVRLDAGLFGALTPASAPSAPALATALPPPEPEPARRELPFSAIGPWLALASVLYAALVRFKTWQVSRASALGGCEPTARFDWKTSASAALAGLSLGSAAALVIWSDLPFLSAAALLLAIAFAAQRSRRARSTRGVAGTWQPLEPKALETRPAPALPGAWLDAGRARGFVLLALALGATTWLSTQLFETSPHYGACVLFASAAWLPIFCTGRAGQLPLDVLSRSRRFSSRALCRLDRIRSLATHPIGRIAEGSEQPDEVRLYMTPERVLPGLIGMELGLEFQSRFGGFSARPVVIVRAADGSPCQRALPRTLRWGRGRKNDERAALIRPKLPTLRHSIALIQELLEVLRLPEPAAAKPSRSKAARSSGKGLSTAKAGTRSSPAHAT